MPSPLQVPGMPNLKGGMQFVDDNNRHSIWMGQQQLGAAFRLRLQAHRQDGSARRIRHLLLAPPSAAPPAAGNGTQGFSRNTPWITNYQGDGQTPCCRLSDPFPGTGPLMPTGSSSGSHVLCRRRDHRAPRCPVQHAERNAVRADLDSRPPARTGRRLRGRRELHRQEGQQALLRRHRRCEPSRPRDRESYTRCAAHRSCHSGAEPLLRKCARQRAVGHSRDYARVSSSGHTRSSPHLSTVPLPVASSSFDALQVKLEKRFSHGFQMLATYSWSKSMDDASVGSLGWMAGICLQPAEPERPRVRSTPSRRSTSRRCSGFSYVYELPFGRERRLATTGIRRSTRFWVAGRPTASGASPVGQPLALYFKGASHCRPTARSVPTSLQTLCKTANENFRQQYFANPEAATKPAPYTLGNAPRESVERVGRPASTAPICHS